MVSPQPFLPRGSELSPFVFQADEPIADYAAMDDVMQGKDQFAFRTW